VKRSILLADDSPTIQRLVKQTFADVDIDIVSVSNGDAAIKKLEAAQPHLVLADVYMPGRNGYEVCAFIKKQPRLSDIPVVLLVGAFDAFDAETAAQAGAVAHITKPFEPRVLMDLVNSLLPAEDAATPESPTYEPGAQSVAEPPNRAALVNPYPPEAEHVVGGIAMSADAAVSSSNGASLDGASLRGTTALQETAIAEVEADGASEDDLLGLSQLFPPDVLHDSAVTPDLALNDEQIDRIVDRVVKKLSSQVIENVAWDVVPDIAEKIIKEKLKKQA